MHIDLHQHVDTSCGRCRHHYNKMARLPDTSCGRTASHALISIWHGRSIWKITISLSLKATDVFSWWSIIPGRSVSLAITVQRPPRHRRPYYLLERVVSVFEPRRTEKAYPWPRRKEKCHGKRGALRSDHIHVKLNLSNNIWSLRFSQTPIYISLFWL